jgi:hypothetical protein
MKTNRGRFVLLLGIWGAAAAVAGAFHLIAHLPRLAVPVLVAGLSVSFSIALWRVRWLGAVMHGLSVRGIVAAHLARFVGIYFLWLQGEGRLPLEFAQRAGWGDVATSLGACLLLLMKEGPVFRRLLLGWNIFGALDLLVAVGTGGWLNAVRPGSMNEIAGFPLALVPLWLVPVFLSTHLYLIRRQFRRSLGQVGHPASALQ